MHCMTSLFHLCHLMTMNSCMPCICMSRVTYSFICVTSWLWTHSYHEWVYDHHIIPTIHNRRQMTWMHHIIPAFMIIISLPPYITDDMNEFMSSYHEWSTLIPPEKLLGGGLSTPVPPFCLFGTIISHKTCGVDLYKNTPQVLAARSFLVAGFDTYVIPRRFSCGIPFTHSYHEWERKGEEGFHIVLQRSVLQRVAACGSVLQWQMIWTHSHYE